MNEVKEITISEGPTKKEVVRLTPAGRKTRKGKPMMDSETIHLSKVGGNWIRTPLDMGGRGRKKKRAS